MGSIEAKLYQQQKKKRKKERKNERKEKKKVFGSNQGSLCSAS